MSLSTQPYKGARDFYPEDKRLQKYIFEKIRQVAESFGYQEYDAPLLESLELYQAKSGDELVNEQTYSFKDRGGRDVAIRPEMTPSVSRMVAARRQELAYPLRLYNIGRRWRYERPQRGRTREFWQADVDLFGVDGIEGDTEIIQIADAILKNLGAQPEMYEIHISSRSNLTKKLDELGLDDAQRQASIKLLDKQKKINPDDFRDMFNQNLGNEKAARLLAFLESNEPPHQVQTALSMLEKAGIKATYDPGIIRGLEYYSDIVFEVFDTDPENARAMFGGGRYDGLVGLFGVEPVPTVGFAIGDVTLQNFLQSHSLIPELGAETGAVAILVGDVYQAAQPVLAELRQKGVNVAVDSTDRKLDSKIKSAAKAGVKFVIFIGEEELAANQFTFRDLDSGEEKALPAAEIAAELGANS